MGIVLEQEREYFRIKILLVHKDGNNFNLK